MDVGAGGQKMGQMSWRCGYVASLSRNGRVGVRWRKRGWAKLVQEVRDHGNGVQMVVAKA